GIDIDVITDADVCVAAGPGADIAPEIPWADAALAAPRRNHRALAAILALLGLGALGWGVSALVPSTAPFDDAARASAAATARAAAPAVLTAVTTTTPATTAPATAAPAESAAEGVRPAAVPNASHPTPTPTGATAPAPASPPVAHREPRPDRVPAAELKAVAAGPRSPKQACGDLNFLALGICLSRTCQTATWRGHPQCVELRRIEDERKRRMEQS
ncbi:MAG: hypothetical protein ABIP61_03035, partial [Burkholderiaceae bacterium]